MKFQLTNNTICARLIRGYGLALLVFILIGLIWCCNLDTPLFYSINHAHIILPTVLWNSLNIVSYSKYPILPISLILLTFFFKRNKLYNVIILIVLFYFIFYIIKNLVHEARPYMVLPSDSFFWLNVAEDTVRSAYKSFPSGHTGNMAVFVFTVSWLFLFHNKLARTLLFLLLVLTGLARICTGWHWPIDVLSGGLIGYMLVRICLAVNLTKKSNVKV